MARADQVRDVVPVVLDAVPRRHFHDDRFARPESDREAAVAAVQALLVARQIRVLKRRLVDVEDGVDVVGNKVVVRVEDVVVISVRGDIVDGFHVAAFLEVPNAVAQLAGREVLGEEYVAVVAGQQAGFEARRAVLARDELGVINGVAAVLDAAVENMPVHISARSSVSLQFPAQLLFAPLERSVVRLRDASVLLDHLCRLERHLDLLVLLVVRRPELLQIVLQQAARLQVLFAAHD